MGNKRNDQLNIDTAEDEIHVIENESNDKDEEVQNRFAALIKAASMLMFALCVLIFVGVAWFTMTKNVESGGMSVKVAADPFELATSGNRVRHNTMFSKLDLSNLGYSEGAETIIDETTYYTTGSDTNNIFVRFDGTENEAKKELEPGGSGIVEFYVIPNKDGDLSIDFNLDIKGYYAQINEETKEVSKLWDISTLTTDSGLTANEIADKKNAFNYLTGHIFFFEKEGDPDAVSNPYYYETPIVDGVYHVDIENAEKGEAYPVQIHWMWPRTYGQIILDYSDAALRSGIPIVKDGSALGPSEDKATVLGIVKDKKASIFKTTTTITDAMIENSASNFSVLSRGYNEADQMIGTNVDYYLLEVSATLAESSS